MVKMWVNMGLMHKEGEVKVASGAMTREMRLADIFVYVGDECQTRKTEYPIVRRITWDINVYLRSKLVSKG